MDAREQLQPQFVAAEAQSLLGEATQRLSISGAVNRQLDAKVTAQEREIERLRRIIIAEFSGDPDKEYDCLKLSNEEFDKKYGKAKQAPPESDTVKPPEGVKS